MSRRWKIVGIFLFLVIVAYFTGKLSRSSVSVPAEFNDARAQGATISEAIVNTSNQLTTDLTRVNDLERDEKIKEAVDLTNELITRSEEVKKQANNLSDQLGKMTGALADIHDDEARALALEAITDRLALISRLISYSDYLSDLLTNLKNRFEGLPYPTNNQVLIDQINGEVTAINNFNRQAVDAMERFDKLAQ